MSGAGNDFVVIDNRDSSISLTTEQIGRICDRYFGVGADGILLIEPEKNGADFNMRFYNPDGSDTMCGNACRCFARFVQPFIKKESVRFQTCEGVIEARYHGDEIELVMTKPHSLKLNQLISLAEGEREVHYIDTGVPHAILYVDDVEKIPVFALGREIRYHSLFAPKGANVNFVKITGSSEISARIYERGVEGETQASGTGVVASALITHLVHHMPLPISVKVRSGRIIKVNAVTRGNDFENVTMLGPAEFIFTGEIEI